MSDTVHYIPGGVPIAGFHDKHFRTIPCGVGKKKWRDLTATVKPEKVTCARCLEAIAGQRNAQNCSQEKP